MIDIEEVSIASSLSSMSDEDEEDDYDILRTEYRAVSFPSEKSNEEEICSVETAKKKDITTLSDLIINRKWKVARERMASHPEEVSEEISLRCFAGGNCKGLPLHLACSMRPLPPPSFTTSLMSYFPAASSTKERLWGMLPLHFACMRIKEDDGRNINNAILNANRHVFAVDSLIKANPQAVRSRESFQGKLPIHMAAASYSSGPSYPQVVKTLARAYPQSMHEKDYYGETPLDIARRIHQWHQYCVDEEKDDFTKNASEIELEEVDTDSISMMFEQPLVQQNQTEQSNAINPISVFLILSLFHNTLGNISPTATDNLEAKYRAIVFDVQGKIKRKKLSKKISKWNKISPFFDVFIGQNKPQGKKQSWYVAILF